MSTFSNSSEVMSISNMESLRDFVHKSIKGSGALSVPEIQYILKDNNVPGKILMTVIHAMVRDGTIAKNHNQTFSIARPASLLDFYDF